MTTTLEQLKALNDVLDQTVEMALKLPHGAGGGPDAYDNEV